jgi:hypothetical protein
MKLDDAKKLKKEDDQENKKANKGKLTTITNQADEELKVFQKQSHLRR